MSLVSCPECHGALSDKALACPACGHPAPQASPPGRHVWPGVLGGVAGTWISAQALVTIVVGVVAVAAFAAIMIALVVSS